MVEAGPEGAARTIEHAYVYVVSDEFVEERIELEGVELPKRWSIKFSLKDLPDPGTRGRARALRRVYEEIDEEPELDEPTDDPVEFLDRLEEWLADESERLTYEQNLRHEAEVARELGLQEFDQEMNDWIEAHGSFRLKAARSKRYKVTSSYARERGRKELPGCWVDTAGIAEYRERVDPSTEALKAENGVEQLLSRHGLPLSTRIVWLVEPPSGLAERYEGLDVDDILEGGEWDFAQQEAILVLGYLSRYDAFLLVDVDVRAPTDEEDES